MIVKYLITDVDGTLFENESLYEEIFSNLLFKKCKIPKEESISYYRNSNGMPVDRQFKEMLCKFGKETGLVDELVKEFFQEADNFLPPLIPGVKRTLALLKRKSILIFASSGNKSDILDSRFKKRRIFKYFTMILGSEVIPKSPVHIEIFSRCAKISRTEFVKYALYVGDGPTDMKIAKECGIKAIGIANGLMEETLRDAGADIIISSFSKLKNHLS
jgi:phosphoglycolate phosphatase-like HAD superfamily hydrolase